MILLFLFVSCNKGAIGIPYVPKSEVAEKEVVKEKESTKEEKKKEEASVPASPVVSTQKIQIEEKPQVAETKKSQEIMEVKKIPEPVVAQTTMKAMVFKPTLNDQKISDLTNNSPKVETPTLIKPVEKTIEVCPVGGHKTEKEIVRSKFLSSLSLENNTLFLPVFYTTQTWEDHAGTTLFNAKDLLYLRYENQEIPIQLEESNREDFLQGKECFYTTLKVTGAKELLERFPKLVTQLLGGKFLPLPVLSIFKLEADHKELLLQKNSAKMYEIATSLEKSLSGEYPSPLVQRWLCNHLYAFDYLNHHKEKYGFCRFQVQKIAPELSLGIPLEHR